MRTKNLEPTQRLEVLVRQLHCCLGSTAADPLYVASKFQKKNFLTRPRYISIEEDTLSNQIQAFQANLQLRLLVY